MGIYDLCIMAILVFLTVFARKTHGACTFPSTIHNYNWTSSNFGFMEFGVDSVNFTDDSATSWTCHVQESNKYIIKSDQSITSLSQTGYYYYCMDITIQNTHSISYYLHSEEDYDGKRRKLFLVTTNVTSASTVCTETQDVASYYVMVRADSPLSARQYCTTPLLGSFTYTYAAASSPSTVLCANYTGVTQVCDTSSRDVMTFNLTACTTVIAFSTTGVLNCIASVTSNDTFYQTVYNNDTNPTTPFVCLAAAYGDAIDGMTSVYVSYFAGSCVAGQNATYTDAGGGYLVMRAYETCPLVSEDSSTTNTGLIVGVVVGVVVLIAALVGLLLYFCWWKKRDPNVGKPIIENTKPRFVDPDKEDILEDLETMDARSAALTRDDVIIEANSPSFIVPNGKSRSLHNGLSVSPVESYKHENKHQPNGSSRRDSGLGTEKSTLDRPTPRIATINTTKESMVIFNGDEKVISGNDVRIVPNVNQKTRAFNTGENPLYSVALSLHGLEDDDEVGELSPRSQYQYPSLPREKSNLMPPMETFSVEEHRTPRL